MLMEDPTIAKFKTLIESPNLAQLRRERELLRQTHPTTDVRCTEPNLAMPMMDTPDPMRTNPRMEKLLPVHNVSRADIAEPKRDDDRTDKELARCRKSVTDAQLPKRAPDRTEKLEPRCAKHNEERGPKISTRLRTERLEPRQQ
jgi:hypothetical protein